MSGGDRDELVTVRILGLPLDVHERAAEHAEELRREFALIIEQVQQGELDGVPHRLLELTRALRSRFAGLTGEQEDAMEAALAAGRDRVDLVFRVPRQVAGAATSILDLMDEADEYCREGRHLLTLATPPELVAYRRWFLGEFIAQSAGGPPTPWAAAAR